MISANRNVVGAGIILAFGVSYAGYALASLQLGTFASMGPGMFPVCIGVALAGIGTLMMLVELRRAGTNDTATVDAWERVEWRSLGAVIAAMSAFAVVITMFGVVPAIFAIVGFAALASDRLRLRTVMLLAAGLSVACWLIFAVALKLPLALFEWPL